MNSPVQVKILLYIDKDTFPPPANHNIAKKSYIFFSLQMQHVFDKEVTNLDKQVITVEM
jgi:hypothetical protein